MTRPPKSRFPESPSEEEFYAAVADSERRHTRERVRYLRRWIADIQADPTNIMNTPDRKQKADGTSFVSKTTDLAAIREALDIVAEHDDVGRKEFAAHQLRDIESRCRQAAARIDIANIRTGKKQRAVLREIRERSNALKSAAAKRRYQEWQEVADKVWASNPGLSKAAVAKVVSARLSSAVANADTIAKRLKKPRIAG